MASRRHKLRNPTQLGLTLGKSTLSPKQRAELRVLHLRGYGSDGTGQDTAFLWKETYDEFTVYRRLFNVDKDRISPKVRPVFLAVMLVRRVAFRAKNGRGVPANDRQWGILRTRMERVFAWVGRGM